MPRGACAFASCRPLAAASNSLDGMQPTRAQVVPNSAPSISTTCLPACRPARYAAIPAVPAPMTAPSTLICFIDTLDWMRSSLCSSMSSRPLRMRAVQATVELERGADQRKMGQCLRKIAQRFATDRNLFGVETNVVRISQHFLEYKPSFVHASRSHQCFCVPERTRAESTFLAGKAVQRITARIAEDQRIDAQFVADGIERGKPARVFRADETHERHHQRRCIEDLRIGRLDEALYLVIPEVCVDIFVNGVADRVPLCERRGQRTFLCETYRAVHRDPAHQSRMQQQPLAVAEFPDPLIRLLPVLCNEVHGACDVAPAVVGNLFAISVVEIDCVQHLAVDVELSLIARGIADQRGLRATAVQLRDDLFFRRLFTIDRVHHAE